MKGYTVEDIIRECQEMQDFLEEPVSNEPDDLSSRLALLNVYMSRSGNMLAIAKSIQDHARKEFFDDNIESLAKIPASVASKMIESATGEANHLVTWLDRINRACTHQSDNLRTIFSYVKENLKLTRNGY